MIPRDVKSPTAPIPFNKLLRVVAIVDRDDQHTKELLDHIVTDNFQIELSDNYERDVSEDASVGAYIVLVDGDRLERARKLAQSVRNISNYEVQGVFHERVDGRIKFHTYVVRE